MIGFILQMLGLFMFWALVFVGGLVLTDRIDRTAEPFPMLVVCAVAATIATVLLWWVS